MKPVFETRSGVQIGLRYETTARPYHDADACRLQKAVTGQRDLIDGDGVLIAMVMAVIIVGVLLAHWMGVFA